MTPITPAPDLLTDLADRVRRLERANRRLARIAGASALLFTLVFLGGGGSIGLVRAAGEEVVTQRLTLTDPAGGTRAILSVVPGLGPSLVIYGENGKAGAALAFPPEGPNLVMYDSSGQLRLRLATIEAAGPSLVLNDSKRKPRLQVSLAGDVPNVTLLNDQGKPTWRTP